MRLWNTNTMQSGSIIRRPLDNDVVGGRGNGSNFHPGNVYFRSLVDEKKAAYTSSSATPYDKNDIINEIIQEVEGLNPSGRFLKEDGASGLWRVMNRKQKMKKTGQALREKTKVDEKVKKAKVYATPVNSTDAGESDESANTNEGSYDQVDNLSAGNKESEYISKTFLNTNKDLQNDDKDDERQRQMSITTDEITNIASNSNSFGKNNPLTPNMNASMMSVYMQSLDFDAMQNSKDFASFFSSSVEDLPMSEEENVDPEQASNFSFSNPNQKEIESSASADDFNSSQCDPLYYVTEKGDTLSHNKNLSHTDSCPPDYYCNQIHNQTDDAPSSCSQSYAEI